MKSKNELPLWGFALLVFLVVAGVLLVIYG